MSNDQTRKFKHKKSRTTLTKAEIADRHLSNFELYLRKGDFGKSFSSLSSALSTLPSLKELYYSSFLEVFEPWSTAVEEDQGFQEAVKLYEVALKHYPDSPDVNYLLAKILYSIYAKRSGAKVVYGCETDKFMYEIGNDILKSNAAAEGMKIFNLHSHNLTIPKDIPKRVSLVVSETLDAGLLGEHILSTLQHAWAHLLLPPPPSVQSEPFTHKTSHSKVDLEQENPPKDSAVEGQTRYGKVIPSGAEVFVALISSKYIANCVKLDNPELIKYFKNKNVLLKLDEPYMSEKLNNIPGGFKMLSEWTPVTKVDFNSPTSIDMHLNGLVNKTLELLCTSEGTVDALALAFKLNLDDTYAINTFPESCAAAWENALYLVSNTKSLKVNDTVKVDFSCCGGIINLCVKADTASGQNMKDNLFLPASSMNFLTRKNFLSNFLIGAKEAAMKMKNLSKTPHSYVICDITPFPIAGLFVKSMFPSAKLYVEEESVLEALREIGISSKLTEDLEEEVNLLFLWPITKEGTLQDGIIKKILMYRLMMAEDGIVFPQKLDLVVDAISSPDLVSMTQVDDSNTCGVKVAEVFNIAKTTHQVDVHLDSLPHTSIIPQPLPVLQLSLTTGNVEALQKLCEQTDDDELLILGGDIVTVLATATAIQSSVLHALSYWFILSGDKNSQFSFCTRDPDSPCKQSLLVPHHFARVSKDVPVDIKVIWRDGIFSTMIHTKAADT
ncbi:protein arginine N-methyltransferase 9-like isoform X2 [Palaemon carinicauda]|uniref:protein arginine N-methyltransferase 9-like isoform X2 n=1 Tax=Palaemon carinicauda TaxID=392227 RepID=UPI0035B68B9C